MGEARMRQINGTYPAVNGGPVVRQKRLRVVGEIRMEIVPSDRVLMLMLGEQFPELATALTAENCRKLSELLAGYAEKLDALPGRIILPGGSVPPEEPGG